MSRTDSGVAPGAVVVVDPLGTGQDYPVVFREAGVETVAVLAAPESLADPFYAASWHPDNFVRIHEYDGDGGRGIDTLAARLREYRPRRVIPGAETGVELADALAERVLPGSGNVPELAAARRDKCAMARAVGAAGIPHPRQTCGTDPDAIGRWLAETGLAGRPLVVKPPKSGGTDDVHLVPAGADWRPYFDRILGKVNLFGLRNEAVLVSEYVAGTEYLIDSYSVDGRHGLVDVCRYTKSRRGDRVGIYELVEFVPPDDPAVPAIWDYTRRVLDALGIRHGCGHTEVIVGDDGPRLVEVGARPAGGGHQMITTLATGTNQLRWTVDDLVHGRHRDTYQLARHVCSVVINAHQAGIWRNAELFADVESLSTFHAKSFDYGTGDMVPAASGLSDFLGWVVLAGPDRAAVQADYRHLKRREAAIVIDPAPAAVAGA